MPDLSVRVAVITGASSGIGRAAALKFANRGWNLVLAARRDKALETLARECEDLGVRAVAVATDVGDEAQVYDLAEEAIRQFGHFDAWVNNAGVATVGFFDEVPMEEHRRVIQTNLLGTMHGCRAALKHFRRRGQGVILNISSVLGKTSHPYQGSYVASKHGITALGICLRQELWLQDANHIHVCTVHPESTDTPFFEHAANHIGYKIKPAPPVDTPEHVADVIYGVACRPQGNQEVIVGRGGKLVSGLMKVARELTARQMAFQSEHAQFDRGKRVGEHSGALFQPMKSGAGVRGGWKKPLGIGTKAAVALGLLVPAGAAAIWWGRTSRRETEQAA